MHSTSSTPSTADRPSLVMTFGTPADIVDWASAAGIVKHADTGRQRPARSCRSSTLQSPCARTCTRCSVRLPAEGCQHPERLLSSRAALPRRCVRAEWQRWRRICTDVAGHSVDAMCDRLADEAVQLLRSRSVARIGSCAGCGWFFLDISRAHARRWCSMNACGVRDKMRRYHQRRARHWTAVRCSGGCRCRHRMRDREGHGPDGSARRHHGRDRCRDRRTDAGLGGRHGRRRPGAAARGRRTRPGGRAFTVSTSPGPAPTPAEIAALNSKIDKPTSTARARPDDRTVEFRALAADDGRSVRFAGIDDLQKFARLVDGTWPTRCDAEACEVVALVAESRRRSARRRILPRTRPSG